MKLATRSAAAAPIGRRRGFSSLTVLCVRPVWPHADPDVLHKGFGSLRRPFGPPPRGADPGLAGRGPERGTTGTLTVSNLYIRLKTHAGKGLTSELVQPCNTALRTSRLLKFR